MARIQILELPTIYRENGTDETPFVLVIDQFEPQRYILGPEHDGMPQLVDQFAAVAQKVGARTTLVFEETVEIPANDLTAHGEPPESDVASLRAERDEARMWARHGYEIGQRHCGWTDHGVAPAWLTEGWPTRFEDCEHLTHASALDEALSRVRSMPTEPEVMNAQQEHPDVWLHGYKYGVLAAKSAIRPRDEKAVKPRQFCYTDDGGDHCTCDGACESDSV
ncbi:MULTISPECIES: hypothetical protein [Streptomyces]|uniref:hypothetical protein n=1 Tax=Streptomyces TaxID=1883 RepID=UPI00067CCA84|nr:MULTISPECIES: hypothetical protein [Streptomyces]